MMRSFALFKGLRPCRPSGCKSVRLQRGDCWPRRNICGREQDTSSEAIEIRRRKLKERTPECVRTPYGDVSPLVFRFRIPATMCFVMVFGSCCEHFFFGMVSVQQFIILLFCNVFRSRFGPDCQKHFILSWFPSDNVKNLCFVIVSRSQVQKLFVLQSLSVQIFPPKNDVIWKGVQVSNAKHIGFVGILRRRRRGQGPPGPLSSPSAFTPLALPPPFFSPQSLHGIPSPKS